MGLGIIILIFIVVWRAKGVISWNLAIHKELKALAEEAENAAPDRQQAIGLIVDTCQVFSRSFSPQQGVNLERLRDFIRSIAACFYPDANQPELQISLGQLIKSLDASLYRFDRIIHQPGLKRINTINIRTIHNLYQWSDDLVRHPWVKWYMAHHSNIQRFTLMRLFIIPDPLSWILFLSRKLLVLVLVKNLLLDITLFTGKLALDAFDGKSDGPVEANRQSPEAVLEDLSHLEMASTLQEDPQIAIIRQDLVGFSTVLISTPTWQDWKTAVRKAAEVLARRQFPDSDRPLEEAAIGPLLVRTRSWLGTLGKGNDIRLVRYFFQTRLSTLFQAKDLSDLVFTSTVRGIMRNSLAAYGWLKWPLKIYRRVKRFSLPGIAADVGWVLGKKSAIALIYGRTFDQACRELDWVYRNSAVLQGTSEREAVGKEVLSDDGCD
ncbi:hypothetical protein [Desulfosarcina variabilis]|uniref:hypothetical protein n=1 Tax=Desulfosarcina variabilis TaxID=2300 RepID=UPI003AFB0545